MSGCVKIKFLNLDSEMSRNSIWCATNGWLWRAKKFDLWNDSEFVTDKGEWK